MRHFIFERDNMLDQEIKYYNKILVAKNSPENKCFVEGGGILILRPKKLRTKRGDVSHNFVDHLDKKTKSKYGWVKAIEPIKLDQFVNKYIGGTEDLRLIEHNKIMLDSIQRLEQDTPVAATYRLTIYQAKQSFVTEKSSHRLPITAYRPTDLSVHLHPRCPIKNFFISKRRKFLKILVESSR